VSSKVGGDLMLGTMVMGSIDVLLFYDECTDHVMHVLAQNNVWKKCGRHGNH
jgi:hypothetical protein